MDTPRRTGGALAAFLVAVVPPATRPAAAEDLVLQARRAADFVDSVGVNTHFTDPDTVYARDSATIRARLAEAGIRHLRDWAIDADGGFSPADGADLFRQLGRSGVRVSFGFNLNVSAEFVQGFPERVAPAFEAYEMPNEFNINRQGDWPTVLRDWSRQFHAYVRAGAVSRGYPIVGPSLVLEAENPYARLGDISGRVDFGNMHDYLGGFHPGIRGWGDPGQGACQAHSYASIEYNLCHAAPASGVKPILATETGWGTGAFARVPVPEAVQAKYVARILLLHFALGVPRTYLYQLADAQGDEGGTHGLLRADGSPKPAFTELAGLLGLLADVGDGDAGPPGTLRVGLTGHDDSVRHLLLRKTDGSSRLILWIEAPSFDPERRRSVEVPARDVRLELPAGGPEARGIVAFADDGRPSTRPVVPGSLGLELRLTDNLTVVELAP